MNKIPRVGFRGGAARGRAN